MKKIEYFVANPAGNITIFVTTPCEREEYQEVASRLFAIKGHRAEQVGFICEDNRMEMSGMEFCGNASRSFALWYAKNRASISGEGKVTVSVSGAEKPLKVEINTENDYTKIAMPKPLRIVSWQDAVNVRESDDTNEGVLVELGGIMHLVLFDVEASEKTFNNYKRLINGAYNPPAMGVMFLNTKTLDLVPVVYVRDVDTTYFEGSCGSGSTAAAIALSYKRHDGEYSYRLKQPAGEITATVYMEAGEVNEVFIEGPVELSEVYSLEIK